MLRANLVIFFVLLVFAATARADVDYTEITFGTHADDAWFKCMADLNGDGRDDLVLGASFGRQAWYESIPGDTWVEHIIDSGGGTASAGWCDDVDGDGRGGAEAVAMIGAQAWGRGQHHVDLPHQDDQTGIRVGKLP